MPERLFQGRQVGLFLDDLGPRVQKNKHGDEVHFADLALRLHPLTPEMASALDEQIRGTLFRRTTAEPVPHLKSVEFNFGIARQVMRVAAAPDTNETIAIDHVAISGIRARTEKGVDGWGLVFRGSFGPLDKRELEFLWDWYTKQKFVTFDEADPSLDFEDDGTEADAKARTPVSRPAPMWDDAKPAEGAVNLTGPDGGVVFQGTDAEFKAAAQRAKKEPVRQRMHSHAKKAKPGRSDRRSTSD